MAQTAMLAATRTHFQGQGGFLGGADRPGAALWEPEASRRGLGAGWGAGGLQMAAVLPGSLFS